MYMKQFESSEQIEGDLLEDFVLSATEVPTGLTGCSIFGYPHIIIRHKFLISYISLMTERAATLSFVMPSVRVASINA